MKSHALTNSAKPVKINPVRLVDVIHEQPRSKKRGWFRRLFDLLSPESDLNYDQFERLESKRTRHQIEREWRG